MSVCKPGLSVEILTVAAPLSRLALSTFAAPSSIKIFPVGDGLSELETEKEILVFSQIGLAVPGIIVKFGSACANALVENEISVSINTSV